MGIQSSFIERTCYERNDNYDANDMFSRIININRKSTNPQTENELLRDYLYEIRKQIYSENESN